MVCLMRVKFYWFFHISDHLEQFGGVSIFLQKNNYLNGWGNPPFPPPAHGKFHENNNCFLLKPSLNGMCILLVKKTFQAIFNSFGFSWDSSSIQDNVFLSVCQSQRLLKSYITLRNEFKFTSVVQYFIPKFISKILDS